MKNQKEVWLPVKGYEGIYEVSNLGNVKVLERIKETRNNNGNFSFKAKEKILKHGDDGGGYMRVVLTKNKIRTTKKVHRLVAESFLNLKENEVK